MTPTTALRVLHADDIFGADPCSDPFTEVGAAERFARLHGDDVRFDHRRQRWLIWSGHRWVPDADSAILRIGIEFTRNWQREALDIPDRERREKAINFAIRLERRDAINNMLAIGRALLPIADSGDGWDSDPWLLGVANGVIDLRTGALRPGRRDDRITMQAGVAFDPDATCPRWERFLAEVFGGDAAMVAFIHRAVGYSISGDTGEQCLFVAHGHGSNGKGTLLNTLRRDVFGDYGHALPFQAIEYDPRPGAPSNELAALLGRRFVVASETNEGRRLNEGRIKWLTGGDPIRARFLYAESFEFLPAAKFWLAVNHRPVVTDDSLGFWRRIRLIPFSQTFPVNPRLGDELRAEAPGILAWAVRGCVAWQRAGGLNPPAAVLDATRDYEADSDPLADFIDEATEADAGAEVSASDLYDAYKRWAERQGFTERERLSATRFGRRMAERFTRRKTREGMVYVGVARRV